MNPRSIAWMALIFPLLVLWGCKEPNNDGSPPQHSEAPDFIQHPDTTAHADTKPNGAVPEVKEQENSKSSTIDLSSFTATKQAKDFIQKTWPTVLENCPGLKTYASDFVISGISDMHESIYGSNVRGIGLTIRINDAPSSIPAGFGAGGHTCNYRVTMDKRSIIFEKDVCMEVCKERSFTHSSSNRVIPLL